MVRPWPFREMGPSTLPSICKSSVPVMVPLMCRLEPRRAKLRVGAGPTPGRLLAGALKATTGSGPLTGAALGASSCFVLLHIIFFLPHGWIGHRVGGTKCIQSIRASAAEANEHLYTLAHFGHDSRVHAQQVPLTVSET